MTDAWEIYWKIQHLDEEAKLVVLALIDYLRRQEHGVPFVPEKRITHTPAQDRG